MDLNPDAVHPTLHDPDFDLLERYLDRELAPSDMKGLERRLLVEPELAAALGRMSAEYAVRQAVWRSLEPGADADAALATGVLGAARRADVRGRFARFARVGGAVAACVLVSFLAGWIGRGYAGAAISANAVAPATSPVQPIEVPQPRINAAEAPFVFEVALTDEAGNITAIQKFERLEDAKAFAADVGRWQARQQQIQDGRVLLMSSGL